MHPLEYKSGQPVVTVRQVRKPEPIDATIVEFLTLSAHYLGLVPPQLQQPDKQTLKESISH